MPIHSSSVGPEVALPVAPSPLDYLLAVARASRRIVGGGLLAGVLAVAGSYLVKPTFTASTVVLPPAQAQSAAAQALSSLGALASIAGGAAGGARAPLDQYVALLQSTTVADRMIERFDLKTVYDEDLRQDARKVFWASLRVGAGRRDGLITIEVDDQQPERAQQMAAAMVEEFRRVTAEIAVTDAQQRRRFFEKRLGETREKLEAAQAALQGGGFGPGALKAEPKAAADSYARLRAEYTAAQVRLQALLSTFTAQAPEVQAQQSIAGSLQAQLRKLEAATVEPQDEAYLSRYRDFKYQEALYELFSRQVEMARVDEGREGGLLQVVDAAQVPEKKTKPRRAFIGVATSLGVGLLLLLATLIRFHLQSTLTPEGLREKLSALKTALRG